MGNSCRKRGGIGECAEVPVEVPDRRSSEFHSRQKTVRAIVKPRPFSPKHEMAIRDVRDVEATEILPQKEKRWWRDIFQKTEPPAPAPPGPRQLPANGLHHVP
ncbi:hypothetical protein DL765_010783 [Monosporascus sp. GIB2]|nr:hypothetical protein DL765_010783 [Monosporascus sp. GIB2]